MLVSSVPGVVQLSIEFGPNGLDVGPEAATRMIADRFAGLASVHKLALTWCLSHPTTELVQTICRSAADHDFGIVGSPALCAVQSERPRFAEQLRRLLLAAESAGLQVRTLVLPEASHEGSWEVLAAQGVDMVRTPWNREVSRPRLPRPERLRHGVLLFPATASFPACGRFLGAWDVGFRAKQSLARSLQHKGFEHLVINAAAVEQLGERGWHALERMLRLLARLRDAGRLEVESMSQTAERLKPVRSGQGQRSILKAA